MQSPDRETRQSFLINGVGGVGKSFMISIQLLVIVLSLFFFSLSNKHSVIGLLEVFSYQNNNELSNQSQHFFQQLLGSWFQIDELI